MTQICGTRHADGPRKIAGTMIAFWWADAMASNNLPTDETEISIKEFWDFFLDFSDLLPKSHPDKQFRLFQKMSRGACKIAPP
jgi:hypothetical protein